MSSIAAASVMTVTGSPPLTVKVGQLYDYAPTVKNGNTSELEFNYINLPDWSKHYRGSGRILGTPTSAGVYANIQIGAWDGAQYAVSAPFTIIVTSTSAPPKPTPPTPKPPSTPTLKISGTPATTVQVGDYYSFSPTVVASAGSKLSYKITNKPTWAQFNAATGALSGTPSASSVGSDSNVDLSVSSGSLTAALPAFAIRVAAAVHGAVTLIWTKPTENTNGSPLTNLAGYVVRYGTKATALTSQVSVGSGSTTSASIENLAAGEWYFEVASVNTARVESQFSTAVSKLIQ